MADCFEQLTRPLLDWYGSHARILPWRSDPTPYRVWISEIMLQQTRVSAVIPYYERFLQRLPTVEALAECEDEVLMKLWEGLGYYSRARNLKKAARKIMDQFGGEFPDRYEEVLSLPGIGDYTAGAICSIALGLPEPAVDGNVLRVFARISGDFSDIAKNETKQRYRARIREVMPNGRTSEYTQALMELGATVCLPNGVPLCDRCPARDFCRALAEGLTDSLPVKSGPKPRKVEERVVGLFFRNGRVALRKRPETGLLSGLWEYPNELMPFDPAAWGIPFEQAAPFGEGRHIFSHIEWQMHGISACACSEELPSGYVWADAEQVRNVYAVPAAFRCFTPLVLDRLEAET